jgi:hypothetical protein
MSALSLQAGIEGESGGAKKPVGFSAFDMEAGIQS